MFCVCARISCAHGRFPSDRYAVESQVRLHGLDPRDAVVEVGPRDGESIIRTEDILKAIEDHKVRAVAFVAFRSWHSKALQDSLAMLMFSGVQYYSGQLRRHALRAWLHVRLTVRLQVL